MYIVLIIMATYMCTLNSAEKQYCVFPARSMELNASIETGSLCSYVYQPSSSDNLLSFENCVQNDKKIQSSFGVNVSNLQPCTDQMKKYDQSCHIRFEMLNFIEHEELFRDFDRESRKCKKKDMTLDFHIKHLTPKVSFSTKLFHDEMDKLEIANVRISESSIDDYVTFKTWMTTNFKKMKTFELNKFKSLNDMGTQFVNSFTYDRLKKIHISDSVIPGIGERSFYITSPPVRELILENVDFAKRKIRTNGIYITRPASNCTNKEQNLAITINNSNLGLSNIDRDFIVLEDNCEKLASDRLNVSLTMTGNVFEHVLSEEHFGGFIREFWHRPDSLLLNLQFEPIECCLLDNAWIFRLQNKKEGKNDNSTFNIDCEDLGSKALTYKNFSQFNEICERRNVYPVLITAVVIISVLAIILAVLSCVCIFYVLPKRGQALVVAHSPKQKVIKSSKSLASKQEEEEKPTAHASKIDSVRTTLTDANTPASRQPLIRSTSERGIQERPQKKSPKKSSSPDAPKSPVNKSLPKYHFKLPGLKKVRGKVLLEKRQHGRLHKQ